ncbi:MAG: transglycosylase SLT domain-containing protein [Acidimicrobiales bacterium]
MNQVMGSGTMPWMEIQSRIADIQSRFASTRPPMALSEPTGSSFADVLARSVEAGKNSGIDLTTGGLNSDGLVTGEQIVELAKQHLGTPYVWGGETPEGGFDCSGLIQYVYKKVGIDLPRVSRDQARAGVPIAGMANARPGDLLAFNSPVDHIGIYAGNNIMIVAPKKGDVVKIQEVTATPTAIRRILPEASTTSQTKGPSASLPTRSVNPSSFDNLFAAAGEQYGISPQLLAAVARAESGMNPQAVSKAGAQGLMQLMPATAAGLGVDPLVPSEAIDGAARLLSSYLNEYGSVEMALAAYNAGPGAVAKYGGVPPYSETQTYIKRVMALLEGVNA